MSSRTSMLVLACLAIASCGKVRDFGCLTNGYWVAAPSHAETGIYDTQQTAVLERSVSQVGVVGRYIVAVCSTLDNDVASLPEEHPCTGVNVIDTGSGRVWRGLSEADARVVLAGAGFAMPRLHSANEWFNQIWPDGNPTAFCRATYAAGLVPEP